MLLSLSTSLLLYLSLFSKCGASLLEIPQILGTESTLEFNFIPHEEDDGIPFVWNASNPFPKYSLSSSPLYFVCDTDLTKRGWGRKSKLTSLLGGTEDSVVTIMNAEEQSCYLIYTKKETVVSKLSSESYSIQTWSHDVKLREGTINGLQRNAQPFIINSLMFLEEQDKDETSIRNKVLNSAKDLLQMGFFSLKQKAKYGGDMNNLCMDAYEHFIFKFSESDEDGLIDMEVNTKKTESFLSSRGIREDCLLTFILSQVFLPSVVSIEIQSNFQFMNDKAQFIVQHYADKDTPWYDVGLDGSGEVVAVSDTGVDTGNCYFWDNDSDSEVGKEIDLTQRKVVQYVPFADSVDEDRHGTHVSGTICGHRSIDGSKDDESKGVANGIAYNAKLAMIDIGNTRGLTLPSIKKLLKTGRPHANVHSASWGGFFNVYDTIARKIDRYLNDNDDLLFVVAAGNSGSFDTFKSLGSPGTTKNGITVGATESHGADLTKKMIGADYVTSFSSKGPTEDKRTKPDILAPGAYILSAGANLKKPGACDPKGEPPRTDDKPKAGLASMQGTSMATPAVSGVASLIRQYFREGFYPSGERNKNDAMENPSSALIKAVILNGGQPVIGVNNAPDGISGDDKIYDSVPYDDIQNYGRVSLVDSLYVKGKSTIHSVVWDRQKIKEGQKKTFSVTIDLRSDQNCERDVFSVTLVWMDKPGFTFCKNCLKNDLDLSVTKNENEKIHFPNGRTKRDKRNNAERVQLGVSHGDVINIHVEGYNLDSDKEKYALVATGCFKSMNDAKTEEIENIEVA